MYKILTIILTLLPALAFAGEMPAYLPLQSAQSLSPLPPRATQLPPVPLLSSTERIDRAVESAISKGLISGGVMLVGNRNGTLFAHAYGRVAPEATARPVTLDTIFDLASLTKVVATTTAIMKLAEERKLSLVDPVRRWFKEFEGKGKDDLLLLNLLTHTSGLDDFSLDPVAPEQSAIHRAAEQRLKGEIGTRFHYADINFILLAELVKVVSGEPLDVYTAKRFFGPLGMKDTLFKPPQELYSRIAPTFGDNPQGSVGRPQDSLARQLGSVAGHAGLFSTAPDLGIFCRMILGGGVLDGKRVMAERTVAQITAPYFSRGGKVIRGLGWDIASPFSTPRGEFFSRASFGHTGYSGGSLWLDVDADLYVIMLTTRLDYKKSGEFRQFRSGLSTLAFEAFGKPVSLQELEDAEGVQ